MNSRKVKNYFDFQLMQFSQQAQHQYPQATCGLFTFDYTLLYTVREWNSDNLFLITVNDSEAYLFL